MKKQYFFTLFLIMSTIIPIMSQSVMTYNIRYATIRDGLNQWNYRKAEVVKLLDYYAPTVFGIQEGLYHQLTYIDDNLENYSYIGVGRDDGQQQGEYTALFYDTTQLNLISQATFWLSETPDSVSKGWDAALPRICTYGLFENKVSQKRFYVFNTHYDHQGQQARVQSSELILQQIKNINADNLPIVLMGDLNAYPDSQPIQTILQDLDNALTISKKPFYGPLGTFTGFKVKAQPKNRIDYIFTKGFEVESYTHLDHRRANNRHISDHFPVYAVLKIK